MASSFAPTIRPPGRADISIYTRPRSASCRRQSGRGHLLGAPDGRFGRSPGLPGLHDLPVRVLLDDLAVPKLEVIAAADFHMVAGRGRARERPLGYALPFRTPKGGLARSGRPEARQSGSGVPREPGPSRRTAVPTDGDRAAPDKA